MTIDRLRLLATRHPDFTQELPSKLLPTRAKEAQPPAREALIYEALFVVRWIRCRINKVLIAQNVVG
jgi:hypothetical protein